ncbi:MAG: hypothetical protein PHC85_00110 [Candidatus Pacebacteria bacterium]|nr:hypothetical protein [Candidatus Paceibacterota bacterium]
MYKRSQNASLRNDEISREIEELQKKKENMSAAINRMESGVGIEEELREKFQVKKPEEEYVVIIDGNNQQGIQMEENGEVSEEKSFWSVFLDFFKIF